VSKADAAAAILWVGATFYALFGGADFGGGFWDLIAGDAEKGERPRALIQRSLTPVWEANHVWLIFILVVLWTAFPPAFSAVMTTLYVPLALAALGIILRGSGFAFRKSIQGLQGRRAAGATFALSSVLTPFFMGAVVGAIASGNVPPDGNGDAFSSWLEPLPLLTGAMFVATGAYLSAVFLVGDARRAGEADLERYFVRRALFAAAVAGAAAATGLIELHAEARYIFDRLVDQGLPLVILSAVCGVALLVLLVRRPRASGDLVAQEDKKSPRPARLALRPLAAGAVVAVIWGWGVAQFPYLLPTTLRIDQAAAPDPTLNIVFIVFAAAAVLVLPSLGLLYTLSQRDMLDGGA
jgi:cytochrome bd ubiquinol oxidase subunit II